MKNLTPNRLIIGGVVVFAIGLVVAVIFLDEIYNVVGDCLGEVDSCNDKSLDGSGLWAQVFSRIPIIGVGLVITGLIWRVFTSFKK